MSDFTIEQLYEVTKKAVEDGYGHCKVSYFVHDSPYLVYSAIMSYAEDEEDIAEEYGMQYPVVYEDHLSLGSW